MIPLVDLKAQYLALKSELDRALNRVIESGAFIGGEEVRAFEDEFRTYCSRTERHEIPLHCASCGNGTDALYLTLRALGVGEGDDVVTVAHTFMATAEAISLTGARPVFIDVCPDTMLMDPDALEEAITPRTRAIVPVHLYGQTCDMTRIGAMAQRYGLKVIEDAAQAHGATWKGKRTGTLGDAACFSFFPGKNLGAYGDGGAVVSRDEALIRRVRMLANHGRLEKYTHATLGVNSRLDAVQAAVLRVKLRHLDAWNAARRRHAAQYAAALHGHGARTPVVHPDAESVWHLFVVRVREREKVQRRLEELGICTGVHYPVPLHLQPAYRNLEPDRSRLPVTERIAGEILSLPLYPELTRDEIEFIAGAVGSMAIERNPEVKLPSCV
jgi:dTDP-4-amino-4,6-dideoxygalactose transaminase